MDGFEISREAMIKDRPLINDYVVDLCSNVRLVYDA